MNNKDRWSALSMQQRADLIKLYVGNGITSLDSIKKDYNSFAPGGPIETDEYGYLADITPAVVTQDLEFNKFLMTLPDNLRLTPEKDYYLYKSWKMNGKPRNFQEGLEANMYSWDDSDNSYHGVTVIGYDENGVGIFGKPKHHDTVHYELDWYNKGLGTLEGGEQYPLQGEERKEWEDFKSQYQLDSTGVDYKYVPRKHYNSFGDGGDTEANQSYSSYSMNAVAPDGNKYVDIITTRENDAYNALLRKGYSIEDARRLSPILTAQSLYETGWKLRDANNNYAGYLSGKNKLKYESADEFWDSHLNNLSERWPNWDAANSVEDYYNIVNQTQLGLKSRAEYNAYKRAHPNTFIYSPEWENSNYKNNLLSTSRRVNAYLNRTSMNKDFPLRELPPQMIFGETLLKTPFFVK